jgi:predicted NAD/FAD-binding protein
MRESLAVIGTGISGLASAWLLQQKYDIEVFEKEDYVGGHTHTVDVAHESTTTPVDTGFIVYNETTYPNLVRLFHFLGVETQPSDMSFAVRCEACDLEYSGTGLGGLFAQKRNLVRPQFWRMLVDIPRFNRLAHALLAKGMSAESTLADFLRENRFSDAFARHYLIPMAAAIWSSGTGDIHQFPAKSLLKFMQNHGLLGITGHHPWRTVTGGSRMYVEAITRDFNGKIHLQTPVRKIERESGGVRLLFDQGEPRNFQHVVIATHADQALNMLAQPSPHESRLLGAWTYSNNATLLHTSVEGMPHRPAARASWNYQLSDCAGHSESACLHYWMNRLQSIAPPPQLVVSLNPITPPPPDAILQEFQYQHPVYSREAMETQSELHTLNGPQNTYFCGAYHRWGFHEDGLVSAIRVADQLGVTFP